MYLKFCTSTELRVMQVYARKVKGAKREPPVCESSALFKWKFRVLALSDN